MPRVIWPLIVLLAGCFQSVTTDQLAKSPVVPFDELFVLKDTVRLDSSVLLGEISFLDISPGGQLLVTDHKGRGIHVFEASGRLQGSYSISDCMPETELNWMSSSRFIGRGRIMVHQFSEATVVFDQDGACYATKRLVNDQFLSFCALDDSIFSFRLYNTDDAFVSVYSPELELVRRVPIEPPQFEGLNQGLGFLGPPGRGMACFANGPFFIYLESMDGLPVFASALQTKSRPEFFRQRKSDLPRGQDSRQLIKLQHEFQSAIAIYALDETTRMVLFTDLGQEWKVNAAQRWTRGISISSNVGQFPSRSAVLTVNPIAASHGHIFVRGDPEPLPDGEMGNPMLVRYRFTPPSK